MASTSATLSICSSVAAHCNVASHHSSPCLVSLSKPSISLVKIVPGFIAPPVGSSRPAFPLAPKFAESESPIVNSDPEASDPEPLETAEDAEIALEKPKREEVLLSSWNFVSRKKKIHDCPEQGGARWHKDTYIGKPVVTNAAVHAVVEDHGLNDKVVVFKYKPKKKYRRNIGHRQSNTRIRITGITGYEDYPAAANVAV